MNLTEQIEFKSFDKLINKIKEFVEKHKWIDYIVAPLFTAIILLIVYALKGVYPFGYNTVSYYDMSGSYIPIYTFVWDVLHGNSGVYLNWYTGMGISMADVVGNFLFFPTNLFFLFTSRNGIVYAMSFFVLIKISLCAFSMSFYFNKHYQGILGSLGSGLLYAFSGFAIQYYTNIFYFDLVILFPILLWAFERLMLEHKYKLFIFLMTFAFFVNVQLVFMLGIYLIFKGYIILKHVPTEKKGKSVGLFFISVIISALLACFILVPSLIQTLNSTRAYMNSSFKYISQMKSVFSEFRRQKYFMLYGSEIAIGVLIRCILKGKDTVKKYSDNLIMIGLLAIPLIHEGINKLWHAGSYRHFPVRFGYILTFECIIFVCEFFKNEEIHEIKYLSRVAKLLGVAAIPFMAYVLFFYFDQFKTLGIQEMGPYYSYGLYVLSLSIMFFLLSLIGTDLTRKISLILLILIQAFCGCYGLFAPETAGVNGYRNVALFRSIDFSNEIKNKYSYDVRMKSDPAEFESNDSIIYGIPSVCAWLYGVPAKTEDALLHNFGYDGAATYLLDTGGTVFSDALLGVKYYGSSNNPDEGLFDNTNTKHLYKSRYTVPFGTIMDDDIAIDDEMVLFNFHNKLFTSTTGLNEELVKVKSADSYIKNVFELNHDEADKIFDLFEASSKIKSDSVHIEEVDTSIENNNDKNSDASDDDDTNTVRKFCLEIPIKNKSVIYLCKTGNLKYDIELELDGEVLPQEAYIYPGNYGYPNQLRNGIVHIGTYENETSYLNIYTLNDKLENIEIGILDIQTLNEGISKIKNNLDINCTFLKNGLNIHGNVNKSGTLFLPIGYSDNWNGKLNGTPIDIKACINDAFIGIDVSEGQIDLKLSYVPKGLKQGISMTLLGFLCLVFLIRIDGIVVQHKVGRIFEIIFVYGYKAVIIVLLVVFYVVPLCIKMSL